MQLQNFFRNNLFIHQPDLRNWDKIDFRSVKQIEYKLMEAQY